MDIFREIADLAGKVDKTTVQYFFSALAQSSAALAALVAVFTVFRLQSSANEVSERFLEALAWLEQHYYRQLLGQRPRVEIRTLFLEATRKQGQLWQSIHVRYNENSKDLQQRQVEIQAFSDALAQSETVHGAVVYDMVFPLGCWGTLFFLSMVCLSVPPILNGDMGWTVMGASLILTAIAGWSTIRFMKMCLTASSGNPVTHTIFQE